MALNQDIGCCTVAEVMGTDLFTLTPETSVASARHLVDVSGTEHLIVIEDGTLAGIVCDADLRAADRDACVADCMTSPVLCISAETTLQEAVDIMGANDVDCLPVVTGAFLVGMVTRAALAIAEQAISEEPACDACGQSETLTVPSEASPGGDAGVWSTVEPKVPRQVATDPDDLHLCHRCRALLDAGGVC